MAEVKEFEANLTKSVFDRVSEMGHEQVLFCNDQATGLKAIIAIHNTTLGPALGGTRMWNYASDDEAVLDVLRLSRGMTYKAAISGLNLGGGKAVIIGDPALKNEAFMRRFGQFVDSLGGRYITAEDVNMKTRDMEYVHLETDHVTGIPQSMGGSGDPSPVTAYGVYMGMKATAKHVLGDDSLAGKKVAVQGVGQVGMYLVDHLTKEGAKVFISDIDAAKLAKVSASSGAEVVGMDEIYDLDVDIYSPNALGATLNDETIPRLKASIVTGGANNQLKEEKKHGYMLIDREITYAPDFLVNAGGLINVGAEYYGPYNSDKAHSDAEKIYDTTLEILKMASDEGISTQEAAIKIADQRIAAIGKLKLPF